MSRKRHLMLNVITTFILYQSSSNCLRISVNLTSPDIKKVGKESIFLPSIKLSEFSKQHPNKEASSATKSLWTEREEVYSTNKVALAKAEREVGVSVKMPWKSKMDPSVALCLSKFTIHNQKISSTIFTSSWFLHTPFQVLQYVQIASLSLSLSLSHFHLRMITKWTTMEVPRPWHF